MKITYHRSAYRMKRGFTLIELLVVIAIIALLAAILFPVFARARENARRSSCQSNMKQIGLGMMQYIQDYDELYPLKDERIYPGGPFASFRQLIQPYMKSPQVFVCPSNPVNKNIGAAAVGDYPAINISYGISGSSSVAYAGVFDNTAGKPVAIASVTTPSTVIATAEMTYPSSDYDVFSHTGAAVAKQLWSGHLGTANFQFADGHVKAMKPLQTIPECDPSVSGCTPTQINLWTRDNRNPSTGYYVNIRADLATVQNMYP